MKVKKIPKARRRSTSTIKTTQRRRSPGRSPSSYLEPADFMLRLGNEALVGGLYLSREQLRLALVDLLPERSQGDSLGKLVDLLASDIAALASNYIQFTLATLSLMRTGLRAGTSNLDEQIVALEKHISGFGKRSHDWLPVLISTPGVRTLRRDVQSGTSKQRKAFQNQLRRAVAGLPGRPKKAPRDSADEDKTLRLMFREAEIAELYARVKEHKNTRGHTSGDDEIRVALREKGIDPKVVDAVLSSRTRQAAAAKILAGKKHRSFAASARRGEKGLGLTRS